MRISSRRYLAAVAIILAVGFALTFVGRGTPYESRASMVFAVVTSLTGIFLGTLALWFSWVVGRSRDAMHVSGALSCILGAIAGTAIALAVNLAVFYQLASLPLVLDVAGCLLGIAIGIGVFYTVRRAVSSLDPRLLSGLVSGALGVVAGGYIGFSVICPVWDAVVFQPHPEAYSGDIVYQFLVFYSIVWTGMISFVLGTGVGISAHTG